MPNKHTGEEGKKKIGFWRGYFWMKHWTPFGASLFALYTISLGWRSTWGLVANVAIFVIGTSRQLFFSHKYFND